MGGWAVDPNGVSVTHAFVYDSLGRLVFATDPDAGDRWHTWTDKNQLAATENAVGDVVAYDYDDGGRLIARTGTSAVTDYDETWTFYYDVWDEPWLETFSPGNLIAIVGPEDSGGGDPEQWFLYDELGRVAWTTRTIVGFGGGSTELTSHFNLSLSGKLLARSWGDGGTRAVGIARDFDEAGRLRWVGWGSSGGNGSWEALEVTPSGATTFERLGNGLGTRFARDDLDQVTAVQVRDTDTAAGATWDLVNHVVNAGNLATFAADFDASSSRTRYAVSLARNAYGAIREVTDDSPVSGQPSRYSVFEYDGAARLTLGEVSGYTFEYAYDALQNMVRREHVAPSTVIPTMLSGDYEHGDGITASRRQLVAVGATTFGYDPAGRMLRTGLGGSSDTTMVFDAFDRLREVDEPGGGSEITRHRYGFDGERIATEWASGEVERYFGDGVSERDGRLEVHVGLGGPRLIGSARTPVSGGDEPIVYLVQGVGPGPAVVADMAGEVIEERFFEPYGAEIESFDEWTEPHGWNAKMVDPSTRWSDHGARWLGTGFGRWLSVDPLARVPNAQRATGDFWSPYGALAGNPVLYWDPDGRQECENYDECMRSQAAFAEELWESQALPGTPGWVKEGAKSIPGIGAVIHAFDGEWAMAGANLLLGAIGRGIGVFGRAATRGADAVIAAAPAVGKAGVKASADAAKAIAANVAGTASKLTPASARSLPNPKTQLDEIIESSRRPAGQSTAGARAIDKKLGSGHTETLPGSSAFADEVATQANAEAIIRRIYSDRRKNRPGDVSEGRDAEGARLSRGGRRMEVPLPRGHRRERTR